MIIKIIMVIIINQYSKFHFKICVNKIIGFLKNSTSLNTRFVAKTHLAVREFLLVAKKKEWFLKKIIIRIIPQFLSWHYLPINRWLSMVVSTS
jgi:hypothetical protein